MMLLTAAKYLIQQNVCPLKEDAVRFVSCFQLDELFCM